MNMQKAKLKRGSAVRSNRIVGRRAGITDTQLCGMIREAVKDRPDLRAPAGMKYVRSEMLDGKPVHCYIET